MDDTSKEIDFIYNGGTKATLSNTGNFSVIGNLNATTLDSLDSTQFLRSDADDSMSGRLAIKTGSFYTVGGNHELNLINSMAIGPSNSDLVYFRYQGAAGEYTIQTYNSGNSGELHLQPYGGIVGIGTDTPSYKLDVSGDIRATGDVIADSDVRLKSEIQTISNAVETVKSLRGTAYIKDGKASIGVIAQEIEEVLPQVVSTADDEMGTKSVAYGNIVAVLIEAIKEQQEQIDELKKLLEAK